MKNKNKAKRKTGFYGLLIQQIRENKKAFAVYLILRTLILIVMVRSLFLRQYESAFVCLLSFALMLLPSFAERQLHIELPTTLEILLYIFIFCAEILGEIECYYLKYPLWDTMLHTVNGFLFAAIGFCLVDILNQSSRFRFALSPLFLTVVAFCFSMTVGTLWEFFEFSNDLFTLSDMQKDFVVSTISSVTFDPTQSNIPVPMSDIVRTTIESADGSVRQIAGYLDIGLIDTMKDLVVNFIGAVIFSIIGFFHVKYRGKGRFARQFIPEYKEKSSKKSDPGKSAEVSQAPSEEAVHAFVQDTAQTPS